MEKFDEAIKIMTEGIKLDPNHKKFDDTPMLNITIIELNVMLESMRIQKPKKI